MGQYSSETGVNITMMDESDARLNPRAYGISLEILTGGVLHSVNKYLVRFSIGNGL